MLIHPRKRDAFKKFSVIDGMMAPFTPFSIWGNSSKPFFTEKVPCDVEIVVNDFPRVLKVDEPLRHSNDKREKKK